MAEEKNAKQTLPTILYCDIKEYIKNKKEMKLRNKENRKIKFRSMFIEKCRKGFNSFLSNHYEKKVNDLEYKKKYYTDEKYFDHFHGRELAELKEKKEKYDKKVEERVNAINEIKEEKRKIQEEQVQEQQTQEEQVQEQQTQEEQVQEQQTQEEQVQEQQTQEEQVQEQQTQEEQVQEQQTQEEQVQEQQTQEEQVQEQQIEEQQLDRNQVGQAFTDVIRTVANQRAMVESTIEAEDEIKEEETKSVAEEQSQTEQVAQPTIDPVVDAMMKQWMSAGEKFTANFNQVSQMHANNVQEYIKQVQENAIKTMATVQNENKNLKSENETLKNTISQRDQSIESLNSEKKQLESDVQSKDAQLEQLRQQLATELALRTAAEQRADKAEKQFTAIKDILGSGTQPVEEATNSVVVPQTAMSQGLTQGEVVANEAGPVKVNRI